MIKIRPHHLLCMKGFQGLGYSSDFIQKMTHVKDMFLNQPELEINLAAETDEICSACPHNIEGVCRKHDTSEIDVRDQDFRVLKALGIPEHTLKTVKELEDIIDERISSFPLLTEICGTCEWREDCLFYRDLKDSWK